MIYPIRHNSLQFDVPQALAPKSLFFPFLFKVRWRTGNEELYANVKGCCIQLHLSVLWGCEELWQKSMGWKYHIYYSFDVPKMHQDLRPWLCSSG